MARHVLIVGGGVIGLCTALECAQRGFRVTVVERNASQRDGCSYGNTGMVVPSHFVPLAAPGAVGLALKWMWNPASPFYVKPRLSADLAAWALKFWRAANDAHVRRAGPLLCSLALASRAQYEALAGEVNDFEFEKRGVLMLCRSQHALHEEAMMAENGRSLGLHAQVLDPKAAAALEPGLRMDIAGAVHYTDDCNVDPARLMASLERRCAAAGVSFRWQSEIRGWHSSGSSIRAVRLASGEGLLADDFVLCAGSWTPALARELGLRLPMQAGKGYSVTLPKPRFVPRGCALLTEARVAVSPMNGRLRFGGTMELAGMDESINPIRVRGIIDAVQRYYPEFGPQDFEGIKPWRGLRPCTPDGVPYVGRTRAKENLIVAAGHAMLGITLGPITGRIAADLLQDTAPKYDLAALSPDRYH